MCLLVLAQDVKSSLEAEVLFTIALGLQVRNLPSLVCVCGSSAGKRPAIEGSIMSVCEMCVKVMKNIVAVKEGALDSRCCVCEKMAVVHHRYPEARPA